MGDNGHGLLTLRHRSLSQHFTGNDEIKAMLLDPFMRFLHHKNLAVETGVQVCTVAVFGVDNDILVFINDINNMKLNAQLLGHPQSVITLGFSLVLLTYGVCMAFNTKPGKEIDAFNMNALFQHNFGGQ